MSMGCDIRARDYLHQVPTGKNKNQIEQSQSMDTIPAAKQATMWNPMEPLRAEKNNYFRWDYWPVQSTNHFWSAQFHYQQLRLIGFQDLEQIKVPGQKKPLSAS